MYGYIYETTNLINGKKYIGKRVSCGYDKYYLGSGILLQRAVTKYGKDNFTQIVLQECYSNDELNDAEKYWIKKKNAAKSNMYYNITDGGDGGNTYKYKSDDEMQLIKKKISESSKMIKHTDGWNRKSGLGRKGIKENFTYKFTDEHKRKLSESNKGKHFVNGPFNKGKRMIHKGETIKYVYSDEIDEYIKLGWKLGSYRKKSF